MNSWTFSILLVSMPVMLFGQHRTKSLFYVEDQDTATANVRNAKVYNIVTYGATTAASNNHDAIQKAIDAAAATGGTVYVPPGTFKTTTGFATIVAQNALFIKGASRFTSIIKLTSGSGNLFTLGTYSSSPVHSYQGEAQDYVFEDIRLEGLDRHMEDDGSRTRIGVQDNGSGGGVFTRVAFSGFKYGFQGTYGSDFTSLSHCFFEFCDTALYFGPNSNQTSFSYCIVYMCRAGMIIEGAYQGSVTNCYFIDATEFDILFRASSSPLSGIPQAGCFEINYEVRDCWFESDANTGLGRIPPRHVWLTGDVTAGWPRYVKIRNPLLVAGGDSSDTHAFVEMQSGIRMTLENLLVYGNEVMYAVKIDTPGYYPEVWQMNTRSVDGYRSVHHYNVSQTDLIDSKSPADPMFNTVSGYHDLVFNTPYSFVFNSTVEATFNTRLYAGADLGIYGKLYSPISEPFNLYDAGRTNWRGRVGWSESTHAMMLENRYTGGSSVTASTSGVVLKGSGDGGGDIIAAFKNASGTQQGIMTADGVLTVTHYKLSSLNSAPSSSSDTGTAGDIRIVNGFIYVCVATNTWQRSALSTW